MVMMLRDFWALWDNIYECVVVTVAMVMLLRDFGPCGIVFMNELL
jgi:hypothetical protein